MTNIYLDVDGVLLDGDKAAKGSAEFIAYVTERFPDTTYWLSGRCSGDETQTVRQLEPYFDHATIARLRKIKPTDWPIIKTQAIDFGEPFLWFDDVLGLTDEEELERHAAVRSLILVDLFEEPDQLLHLVQAFPEP